MTNADDRLRALFAEDEPPARDPIFNAAVMEAVMRRRFHQDMALLGGASAVGGLVLWALWPALQPMLTGTAEIAAPFAAALAMGVGAVFVLSGGRMSNPLKTST